MKTSNAILKFPTWDLVTWQQCLLRSCPIIQGGGGAKVNGHTLGLIPPSCFIFEGCCFADGILYLLVRGFRRQNLKIRIF